MTYLGQRGHRYLPITAGRYSAPDGGRRAYRPCDRCRDRDGAIVAQHEHLGVVFRSSSQSSLNQSIAKTTNRSGAVPPPIEATRGTIEAGGWQIPTSRCDQGRRQANRLFSESATSTRPVAQSSERVELSSFNL